jgi:hypothetical protein
LKSGVSKSVLTDWWFLRMSFYLRDGRGK